ncbi:MAG: hypothetical protein QOG34_2114 [Frankiaceae bacterium]|nr:hypothetical protein [Frankiaceae bacterium]
MLAASNRLAGAIAFGLALTLGAGLGAVARGDHVVVHRVGASAPAPTPSATPKPTPTADRSGTVSQQRVRHIAEREGFAFLRPPGRNGEVSRWDPCVPIHYVVDVEIGPPTAAADIAWAIAQVSKATGMRFVDDGTTAEQPDDRRKDVRHTKSGWRWAPVLIALVPDSVFHGKGLHADKDSLAYTDPAIYSDDAGDAEIVTAQVVVDADDITDGGHEDPGALGPTLLHEFGHLAGLDHVHRSGEIMQPDGGGVVSYGPGDLAGLHYVGRAHGCVADAALPTDSDDFPR